MAVTRGFTGLLPTLDTKPQVNVGCDVSEGGLELPGHEGHGTAPGYTRNHS
jgi:hypothetical protein